MKNYIKAILIVFLAIIIVISSLVVVAAEEVKTNVDGTQITTTDDGENIRAYELVWKYKTDGTHVWKRRWNRTLGCWYDPAWILVY